MLLVRPITTASYAVSVRRDASSVHVSFRRSSRSSPCASLVLHLHQVAQGTPRPPGMPGAHSPAPKAQGCGDRGRCTIAGAVHSRDTHTTPSVLRRRSTTSQIYTSWTDVILDYWGVHSGRSGVPALRAGKPGRTAFARGPRGLHLRELRSGVWHQRHGPEAL